MEPDMLITKERTLMAEISQTSQEPKQIVPTGALKTKNASPLIITPHKNTAIS